MKKAIFFLISSLLLAACTSESGTVSPGEKYAFYQIPELAGMSFRYPAEALIVDGTEPGSIVLENCKVYFGKDSFQADEVKEKEDSQFVFKAFYQDGEPVHYQAALKNKEFYFWLDDNVQNCLDFFDLITGSFTDKPIYFNSRFGFEVLLVPEFKVEDLPDQEGILMKKWNMDPGFLVEIGAFGSENVMGFSTLADFIEKKYTGYTAEFSENGVFIDESLTKTEAKRHFFIETKNPRLGRGVRLKRSIE